MSFKTHLVIISVIIVTVTFVWQLMSAPKPVEAPVVVQQSRYSVIVSHASWGLNCRDQQSDTPVRFRSSNLLYEDNVREKLANHCAGKVRCDIPVNVGALGDPDPSCPYKDLVVEYRCFAYDRPDVAHSSGGVMSINCDRAQPSLNPSATPQPQPAAPQNR